MVQIPEQGVFLNFDDIGPDVRWNFNPGDSGQKGSHPFPVILSKTGDQFRLDQTADTNFTLFQEGVKDLRGSLSFFRSSLFDFPAERGEHSPELKNFFAIDN